MSIRPALLTCLIGLIAAGLAVRSTADTASSVPTPAGPTPHAAHANLRADPWQGVHAILARIVPPTFPERVVRLADYGAVGDGATDCTRAFREAIEACSGQGGGRVEVPSGRFLTGAIHLLSNVELHVPRGAAVLFKQDPAAYLPPVRTRYEGNDCLNYSPFIYALDQQNVAITGEGTIDGRADIQVWKGMDRDSTDQDRLREMAEKGVPVERRVFGAGHRLRPNLIEFYGCTGVLLEGVTVKNGPMWTIHPLLCKNVTIRGVTVESSVPNGDGIDPESSRGVHIQDCTFATRDDAIALKAGRNADGRRVNVPCEDVVVQHCTIRGVGGRARNGIAVGSEMSAGVRNLFVEDCTVSDRYRGISLKTNTLRGGFIEDVYFRNVSFQKLEDTMLMIDLAFGTERGPYSPYVRRVELRGVTVAGAERLWEVDAPNPLALSDLAFVDCRFTGIQALPIPKYLARMTAVGTTLNGELLSTPAKPWFDSTPSAIALVAVAVGAFLLGALAVRTSRRFGWLALVALVGLGGALLQFEPDLPRWLGGPGPMVENRRIAIVWTLGALVVAVLGALTQLWARRAGKAVRTPAGVSLQPPAQALTHEKDPGQ